MWLRQFPPAPTLQGSSRAQAPTGLFVAGAVPVISVPSLPPTPPHGHLPNSRSPARPHPEAVQCGPRPCSAPFCAVLVYLWGLECSQGPAPAKPRAGSKGSEMQPRSLP